MSAFAESLPHGDLDEIFPDVFLVRGTFRAAPGLSFGRNMIVLREGDALTLVNSVRLSPEGERALDRLGTVRHLVRLGFFHTRDDPYYRSRYSPTCWTSLPPDAATERLADGGASPHPRARVFSFQNAQKGEAALLLTQPAGDLLITCDSVQHWPDTTRCSLGGALACRVMGFLRRPLTLGPIWLKEMTGGRPQALRPDFERLLSHDFAHLVSAHGEVLRDTARADLRRSCTSTLGME
ncbi:MAG: hypothetical protein Q8S73_41335 [Deltaproteobacteria bacterium]|nr:hypothetical protein [Myxococcales bacterium]MDP3220605.1 hypothetical protein [Deltaproteobacteria bacterium]